MFIDVGLGFLGEKNLVEIMNLGILWFKKSKKIFIVLFFGENLKLIVVL